MDKALTDAAIKAIDALITDELSTSSPGRYDHIIKLSKHAHNIAQIATTRVKQVAERLDDNLLQNDYGEIVEERAVAMRGGQGVAMHEGGFDNVDLLREIVAGMQTALKPRETLPPFPPLPPPSPLDKLHSLLDLRERLIVAHKKVDIVDKQIDELMKNVAEEDFDVRPALLASVAHPVVLRGHPARADVHGVPDDHGGALGEGEGGAGGPVDVGGEEEVATRG